MRFVVTADLWGSCGGGQQLRNHEQDTLCIDNIGREDGAFLKRMYNCPAILDITLQGNNG